MNIVEYIPENIVPILVFAVLITLIFQLIRRRSLKGAMFGAEITETVGSFEIWKSSAGKRVLSVHRLKEEVIDIIEDDDHGFTLNFVHAALVEGISQHSHLIELISEHVFVLYIEQIHEEIDLEHSTLDEVGGRLDREGCLAHSWVPVKKEHHVLIVLYRLHELIQILLATHHRVVRHFLVRLD